MSTIIGSFIDGEEEVDVVIYFDSEILEKVEDEIEWKHKIVHMKGLTDRINAELVTRWFNENQREADEIALDDY